MKLIFMYGMPATGKLTVARELKEITGYKLFHNHLVVDLLLSVFPFGSAPFVELREEIWLRVFAEAGKSGVPGMIFTFNPENTVRPEFVGNAQRVLEEAGGTVEFVELVCPVDEVKRRLDTEARRGFKKITSVGLFEELLALGVFDALVMPQARIVIDTSRVPPRVAAREIAARLGIAGNRE